MLARARPHVDEPVRGAHHLLVVLDDENGVAQILEPLERRDQPAVVALVQSDRRLVEDVEHPDQLRTDLGREPKPLRFAAGERLRGTVELEVADADVVQEGEPLADLLDDPMADQLLGRRQAELVEEAQRACHRHAGELVDRQPADRDCEHLGLEPRPVAGAARAEAHVLLDPLALLRRIRLPVAALERGDDPLEGHRVRPSATHPVPVLDVELVALRAVEEEVLLLGRQVAPGRVGVDLVPVADRLDDGVVEPSVADRPGNEGAVADRHARVRNDQVGIDLELRAEPGAARARSVR